MGSGKRTLNFTRQHLQMIGKFIEQGIPGRALLALIKWEC
jgi:hypothetical protein